ncbi:global transcription factor group E4 [Actinidia rufa]|uniref:Global transcription factor group E4 n=1 Tax=Actinidia rufa TaxID=165716 RepID=A0A7J0G2X5_9ERIC|nr:global transcription factor group E4 [Actinidia rufa]
MIDEEIEGFERDRGARVFLALVHVWLRDFSKDDNNNGNTVPQLTSPTLATEEANSPQRKHTETQLEVVSDDLLGQNKAPEITAPNSDEPPDENGVVKPIITRVDDRVRINLEPGRSKSEVRELKRKLVSELGQVRGIQKKLEDKAVLLTGYSTIGGHSHSQYSGNGGRALVRVHSEVGSVGHHDSRPFQQLGVSVIEHNHGFGDFVEKEKRTPKANPYYRNSEFLLGKDRLPPAESNKKTKSNSGRKHSGEMGYGFGIDKYTSHVLKNCNNLLSRLMKHKYAWVFNKPVDAKALGLHDYHDVIKYPMDLGTVKNRLSKNWYKSPREFAEDVRLTFRNAMTYNPKGQDVHVMADEMSKMFEDKWTALESEYNLDWRYELVHDLGLPTPTSRRVQPFPLPQPPVSEVRTFDRVESMTGMPVDSKLKSNTRMGRTPVPKKPKANDPHKRDMTYEEKQRLSTNLQSLPAEKLDNKHFGTLIDRFVTNYKKSLSKNKRKAELALQARAEATPTVPAMNPAQATADAPKESKIGEKIAATSPAQGERQGDNVSRSSSSSTSSSDSGSSSSDSDSDRSSASDAEHSPRT